MARTRPALPRAISRPTPIAPRSRLPAARAVAGGAGRSSRDPQRHILPRASARGLSREAAPLEGLQEGAERQHAADRAGDARHPENRAVPFCIPKAEQERTDAAAIDGRQTAEIDRQIPYAALQPRTHARQESSSRRARENAPGEAHPRVSSHPPLPDSNRLAHHGVPSPFSRNSHLDTEGPAGRFQGVARFYRTGRGRATSSRAPVLACANGWLSNPRPGDRGRRERGPSAR